MTGTPAHCQPALLNAGVAHRVLYDANAIEGILDEYVAVRSLQGCAGVPPRSLRRLLEDCRRLQIGKVVLISKDDAIGFLQRLNSYRDRNLSVGRKSQVGLAESRTLVGRKKSQKHQTP